MTIPKEALPFDQLLNSLNIGVFRQSTGRTPKVCFMNEFLRAQLGCAKDEIIEILPESLFAKKRTFDALLKQAVLKGKVFKDQVAMKAKDGRRFTAAVSLVAVRPVSGKVRFIDGIVENISFAGTADKKSAAPRELFKIVFNQSAAAILVTDQDDRIVAWNPFAEKILGMGWEDLFNRSVWDIHPSEERRRLRVLISRKKDMISDIDTKLLRKDGHILDVNLSFSIMRDTRGGSAGTIRIMSDVSSQKKTQKMLLDAKRAAEAASEAKTMFLANMSHEVRTPMNTILGMVDLTLDTDLSSEQRDNLLTVKNAADILLSLLNDILDLSRVEAGKIQLEHIEINIERIVRSVCKTMDILARNKGLNLQWLIDESVPDMVKGDPVRIRQILVNLINNAIKFTQQGKIRVEVKARPKNAQDTCELLFSVSDEGIGIDKDKQEKIFDVFTQEDVSTTRQFGGTGLGLSICKKLLELMGGRIWVESEKGKGSAFSFIIPSTIVKREDVPDALQEESIESQLMAQVSRRQFQDSPKEQKDHLHILLAEDNLVNQKMTQRILEKKGWQVTVANNGQEVLDLLKNQKFDLILMDAQMPVMDGLESTRQVRQMEAGTERRIPIVALTARAMSGDRKKCLDAGMDGYVSKPIDRAQLYETIESFFVT